MSAPGNEQSLPTPPTCAACREVIGVYERLVHVVAGAARRTSRAAEPGVTICDGAYYHLACYEGGHGLDAG